MQYFPNYTIKDLLELFKSSVIGSRPNQALYLDVVANMIFLNIPSPRALVIVPEAGDGAYSCMDKFTESVLRFTIDYFLKHRTLCGRSSNADSASDVEQVLNYQIPLISVRTRDKEWETYVRLTTLFTPAMSFEEVEL